MTITILLLVLLLALVGFSAFFSGSETALFSLSRARLLACRQSQDGPRRAITELMDSYHHTLTVLILGNMFVNVCISMVEDELIHSLAIGKLAADILSVVMAVFLLLIFGEVTPKTIAMVHAEALALKIARPVWLLRWMLNPFIIFVNSCFSVILDMLGRRQSEPLSHDEYAAFLETAYNGGMVSAQEKELLDSALLMSEKKVGDVMTGRIDIRTIRKTDDAAAIAKFIKTEKQGYFPVIGHDIDDAEYMLSTKRFFMLPPEERHNWRQSPAMIPVLFVPDGAAVNQALNNMTKARVAVALATDEYGRVAGMVTKEDIFAEMIGDIDDEYDQPDYSFNRLDDGTWEFTGMIPLYLFEEVTGWVLPESLDSTTINGALAETLGHIPQVGDEVHIDGITLLVEDISRHRATRFKAMKTAGTATEVPDETTAVEL